MACCVTCKGPLPPSTGPIRYCSSVCRQTAYRERKRHVAVLPPAADVSTVAAVRAELVRASRVDTYLGRAALALADRIDSASAVMGFAALVKQLQSTMDAALEGVPAAADPLDEVRAARDRKMASG
jgi:hypothetical protein